MSDPGSAFEVAIERIANFVWNEKRDKWAPVFNDRGTHAAWLNGLLRDTNIEPLIREPREGRPGFNPSLPDGRFEQEVTFLKALFTREDARQKSCWAEIHHALAVRMDELWREAYEHALWEGFKAGAGYPGLFRIWKPTDAEKEQWYVGFRQTPQGATPPRVSKKANKERHESY